MNNQSGWWMDIEGIIALRLRQGTRVFPAPCEITCALMTRHYRHLLRRRAGRHLGRHCLPARQTLRHIRIVAAWIAAVIPVLCRPLGWRYFTDRWQIRVRVGINRRRIKIPYPTHYPPPSPAPVVRAMIPMAAAPKQHVVFAESPNIASEACMAIRAVVTLAFTFTVIVTMAVAMLVCIARLYRKGQKQRSNESGQNDFLHTCSSLQKYRNEPFTSLAIGLSCARTPFAF